MDRVSTIMSRPVVAIRSDCDLLVAVDTLVRRSVRHLVVVDPDRHVRGLLSAERVLAAQGSGGRVDDLLLPTPTRVRPDDDVRRAAALMLDQLAEALLVAEDDGHVVGIVTWSDIAEWGRSTTTPAAQSAR